MKIIDNRLLKKTSRLAARSKRLRQNHNFHQLPDKVQRMLNAIEPDSYVRPHRHLTPPKVELFIILKGRGAAINFSPKGDIIESIIMEPMGNAPGVEFPPGEWHTLLSLSKGTVFFEVKDGPYDAAIDKEFAPWAPDESEKKAATAYLKKLKKQILEKDNL